MDLIYKHVHRQTHHRVASTRDQCEQRSVVGKWPIILYIVHKRSVLRVMPGKLIMQLSTTPESIPQTDTRKQKKKDRKRKGLPSVAFLLTRPQPAA